MAEAPNVSVEQLEVHADSFDVREAVEKYTEHGALVVRGLMKQYVEAVREDIEAAAWQAISVLDQARRVTEGWLTPDGTLFLPAPPGFPRDKQIMVLAAGYRTSAAFFRSAFEERLVAFVREVLGPDVELFGDGQCLYKEPVGGHPKNLHQDSAYFEHRYEGPVAALSYAVDTDLVNGALYVVPGSHRFGTLRHIDTFSHLGLDPDEWPWEAALPITGQAGDTILFHYRTIHGSQENHSTRPRPVFIHRYRRANDFVTVSATTAANREEAEKRASEARKQNQKGIMVCGRRMWEPEE